MGALPTWTGASPDLEGLDGSLEMRQLFQAPRDPLLKRLCWFENANEQSKSNLPMDRSDQLSILNTVMISSFFTELLCQDHQTLIYPYFGIGQEV